MDQNDHLMVNALNKPIDSPQASQSRVLLVEDDVVSGSALASILRRRGFEVIYVTTVAEGIARLADHPQFVVLDLMLPDGDGAAILNLVRLQQPAVRVLVTTAVNDPERLRQVRDLKPELILQKPIDLGRLLASMEKKEQQKEQQKNN